MKKNTANENLMIEKIPLLSLRGITIMPNCSTHFDVGREKSKNAVELSMESDRRIFLISQRDIRVEDPKFDDLYKIGTVCKIKQVLKIPEIGLRVLVEGLYKAKLVSGNFNKDINFAEITKIEEDIRYNKLKAEALLRNIQDAFSELSSFMPKMPSEIIMNVMGESDPVFVVDYICTNIPLKFNDKQSILETQSVIKRMEKLLNILNREIDILNLEQNISEKVKESIDKNQREYYLREQLKAINAELGAEENVTEEAFEYQEKILKKNFEPKIEEKLIKEAVRLSKLPYGSHEGTVIRTYLDTCLELPINKKTKENDDLKKSIKILDKDFYGLKDVKERIIEFLAVKHFAPDMRGQIICLAGPPGVGKTSIGKTIAKALNRNFVRFSLGGISDEAEIRGHRKTYIGAMPGRIITALKNSKSLNPVILLDEIDKLGYGVKGDPSAALLEALDPEQNKDFCDHFIEFPVNLSDVLFITTANDVGNIPRPLLDRMELISLTSYTPEEKFHIAKEHLLLKQLKKAGLNKKQVKISDGAINSLIDFYTRESGVRNLERELSSLIRKCAKKLLIDDVKSVIVTENNITEFLGPHKFDIEKISKENQIGIVNGLAYTSVGGEMLEIEVNVMPGSGKITLTGSLGDVMKESATQAITFVRSKAEEMGIDKDFYKNLDIHIHAPEGAIPKDGPSAGVTMATALISELTKIPVKSDVAMTGEVTLRGRVLKIGGLKEKTMAAYKAGVKTVIVPFENLPNIEETANVVKENIKFIGAKTMTEVLENALERTPFVKSDDKKNVILPKKENKGSFITQ